MQAALCTLPPYAHCLEQDKWALPGGFVDENESLDHAAARELKEETSVDITSSQALLTQVGSPHTVMCQLLAMRLAQPLVPNQNQTLCASAPHHSSPPPQVFTTTTAPACVGASACLGVISVIRSTCARVHALRVRMYAMTESRMHP